VGPPPDNFCFHFSTAVDLDDARVRRPRWRARQVNRTAGRAMGKNPILDLPLSDFMRSEIALPLQHVLKLYTVGSFLNAWRNPKNHRSIEQVFETPQQARHAVAVCAAWLGVQSLASQPSVTPWWIGDQPLALSA
jgi:hypothetical protein